MAANPFGAHPAQADRYIAVCSDVEICVCEDDRDDIAMTFYKKSLVVFGISIGCYL